MNRVRLVPVAAAPWVERWGADGWSFNLAWDDEDDRDPDSDGSGLPGREMVGAAMALWVSVTPGADARLAASVFNLPPALAEDAFSGRFQASGLVDALQVWSSCVGCHVPVDLAAAVFAVPVSDVLAAIDSHHWMFVERPGDVSCIGHEGE